MRMHLCVLWGSFSALITSELTERSVHGYVGTAYTQGCQDSVKEMRYFYQVLLGNE